MITLDQVCNELIKYPKIEQAVGLPKFRVKASAKYGKSWSFEMKEDGPPCDLFQALALSTRWQWQQSGNAATPEGILITINEILNSISLSQKEISNFGSKLLNFGTSSLWDTFSELGLLFHLKKAMPETNIEIELKLPGSNKDADIAILDQSGKPVLFGDVYTPQRKDDFFIDEGNARSWIANKYNSKFRDFCTQNPSVSVTLFVSAILNESVYMMSVEKITKNITHVLNPGNLNQKNGLVLASIFSFRCPDQTNKLLVFDPICKYENLSG